MRRLLDLVNETFGRRDHREPSEQGETDARATHDLDPWSSYVKVLEEARERRGRLFSRS